MDKPDHKTDVLIIGGGWAGLSAAIELVANGKSIFLIESAKQLGGRARTVKVKQTTVDNGTHIMIGAYTETLRLIQKVYPFASYSTEKDLLKRQCLSLHYKQKLKASITLPCIPLPAPFNIIGSFLFARGLSLKDKLCVLVLGTKIKLKLIKIPFDLGLQDFFVQQKQTESVIQSVWEPLCLAIMNTPIKHASTEIFLQVLKESFFKSRQASDLIFFKKSLSEILPIPAEKYITQHNGKILPEQKALSITKENNFYSVTTASFQLQAKHIVLATPPPAAAKLLTGLNTQQILDPVIKNLNQFSYQTICTVYLQYPETIHCERSMQGFIGTTSQWMFNKTSLTNQPGLVSIIISSDGPHLEMDNPSLIKTVTEELAQFYPHWPEPLDAFVIREKRATFTASININRIRPTNKTVINNIWLAGDYTNTQYPATLEGAVRSGLQCAQQILAE